ncbi:MAG: SDR family oxidoreductase [Chloroflexi bacterium]|nr:SDR family oxidoreductase [Chloroflexota bacterium]MQC27493.1 SDR family oxidoreductase [Chloroflexota bacterium]
MATPLEGRTVLITGSGRGIGREVALLAGQLGANVIVNDPGVNVDGSGGDQGPAADVAKEIKDAGGTASANFDSVATAEGGENMIKQAIDEYGRIDGVVHVAGILRDRMIFNMSEQEWDDVVAVHLTGFFNVVKPASVLMRQQRFGRIVGFSSASGLVGNTGQANYGAAKAGIAGMARCVARDLGRYGVTANAIGPGAATRMTQTVPDAARQMRSRAGVQGAGGPATPQSIVNQLREPKYVAPMVCYLLSDQAWDVNGKVFNVAGGVVSVSWDETPDRTIAKAGMWELDELQTLVPQMMAGLRNPAPPPPELDLPGRPVAQEASA